MTTSIKVADLFTQIGARVDVRQLDKFQKRLAQVKKQLLQLKKISRTPLSPNTNIAAVRALNTELGRTVRLARQIQNQGPIRVRRSGGGAGGRGRGRQGAGIGGGSVFGGLAAGAGAGRVPVFARQFFAGFGTAIAVRKLFQASAAMQGIEVALQAVTREGQTTTEVMGFLRGEADRLGFEFETSAFEFAKLAAAGNAAGLSIQEIQELFIGAQEAARVFNLSASATEGVLKAFTQIVSKGKVTAEELRNQLGDQLPAAVPIFAAALGVTTQELSAMLEKGEILANESLPKFGRELRKTFAGQIPAAANNLTAAFNRFNNSFFFFLAGLGKSGISDIFKKILLGGTRMFEILTPAFKLLISTVRALVTPIEAVGRIFNSFFSSIPGWVSTVTILSAALFLLRKKLLAVTAAQLAALTPWILGGAAIAAIVILIDDLATAMRGGTSIIGEMAENGNTLAKFFSRVLLIIGELIVFMTDLFAAVFNLSFDPLTDSLDRFISKIRDLSGLTAASGFVTNLLESVIGLPGSPDPNLPALAGAGAGGVIVRIDANVTGSPEDLKQAAREAVIEGLESQNIQAQAEFGNNE